MPLARHQTELLLDDLEQRIRGRSRWRGQDLFYRMLEFDLLPILETAEDPAYVRGWAVAMLARNGHAPGHPAAGRLPVADALVLGSNEEG